MVSYDISILVISEPFQVNRNTEELTKKAFKRMQLLNAAAAFTSNRKHLKDINLTFIRSIVEQSAIVWHSGLPKRNKKDMERVQKAAVRVIMGKSYKNYTNSLSELKLYSLEKRRELLSLRFAKNCLRNEKMKNLFPLKKNKMEKRKNRKFETKKINT